MKLGIEASSLLHEHYSGITYYIRNLVDAILELKKPELDLKLLYKLSRFKKRANVYMPERASWFYGNIYPLFNKLDLIHCTDNQFIKRKGAKTVMTIHDLALFKVEGISSNTFLKKVRHKMDKVFKETDAIIAVSNNTKEDIKYFFNYPEDKIFVTPLGYRGLEVKLKADQDEVLLNRFNLLNKDYFLFVGTISTRKNVVRLIQAYASLKECKEKKLVLAGLLGYGSNEVLELIKKENLQDRVILTGYLNEQQIDCFYRHATAFLFPTIYEGFGLPIIEAMHYGLPVLVGDMGASKETAGNLASVCNPFSVDSIKQGIVEICTKPVDTKKLIEHASKFTWEATARKTIEVYKKVLS